MGQKTSFFDIKNAVFYAFFKAVTKCVHYRPRFEKKVKKSAQIVWPKFDTFFVIFIPNPDFDKIWIFLKNVQNEVLQRE